MKGNRITNFQEEGHFFAMILNPFPGLIQTFSLLVCHIKGQIEYLIRMIIGRRVLFPIFPKTLNSLEK